MKALLDALNLDSIHSLTASVMLIMFASSWVVNILKSIRARTAKGKSVLFELIIYAGYIVGTVGLIVDGVFGFMFWCYVLDLVLVTIDLIFTLRNVALDRRG